MNDPAGGKPPREPILDRMTRLGIRQHQSSGGPSVPKRVFRTSRYRRELDEISFNKPNTNKTK